MFRRRSREGQKNGFHIRHWQLIAAMLILWDIMAVTASYFLALLIRFDGVYSDIPAVYLKAFSYIAPGYAVFCIIVFWLFRLYTSMWRFASYRELFNGILATGVATVIHTVVITLIIQAISKRRDRMPMSYYLTGPVIQFFLTMGVRFTYRFLLLLRGKRREEKSGGKRVMIIGAGETGRLILRDINHTPDTTDRVVCVIDDNENKWKRRIDGVPVVGGRNDIQKMAERYRVDKIYFAIPSATPEQRRDILKLCSETGCELKQLPGIAQLANGEISVSRMKNVSVEDLLGREPICPDLTDVFEMIHGKRVLVTGGGGSIGSELCRQIAAHEPEQLVIFDIYENNAYAIQLELKQKYPELNLVTLIGSVRDSRKVFDLFETYKPQIVYHAAAHKHVPLMEDSPCEAIKNNAIGTYKTAYAAMVHGTERFVLISTDKAVNPTNIMGASKRLCEMIIQSFDAKIKAGKAADIPQLFTHPGSREATVTVGVLKDIRTEFVAVRFGNVLGSNGSVIPLFRKQIEQGGPVTVTHPDIIRYFMTIPEAVSLVMLAGSFAHGGEIFVLDMGSPVRIDDLARNLIRLSGLKPDIDIKIEYTGLRPGEKLYEEKLMAEEGLQKTENDLIHIGKPVAFDVDAFLGRLEELMIAAYKNKNDIKERVKAMVSTYRPAAEKAEEEGTAPDGKKEGAAL